MTKRELKSEINQVLNYLGFSYRGSSGQLYDLGKNIEDKLDKIRKNQEERWEMLKDYLKVEEKEYAELEDPNSYRYFMPAFYDGEEEVKAVKKTKLVKKKK